MEKELEGGNWHDGKGCEAHNEGNNGCHLPWGQNGRTLGKPWDKYCLLAPFSMEGMKVPSKKFKRGKWDLCFIHREKIEE